MSSLIRIMKTHQQLRTVEVPQKPIRKTQSSLILRARIQETERLKRRELECTVLLASDELLSSLPSLSLIMAAPLQMQFSWSERTDLAPLTSPRQTTFSNSRASRLKRQRTRARVIMQAANATSFEYDHRALLLVRSRGAALCISEHLRQGTCLSSSILLKCCYFTQGKFPMTAPV